MAPCGGSKSQAGWRSYGPDGLGTHRTMFSPVTLQDITAVTPQIVQFWINLRPRFGTLRPFATWT